MIEKLKKLSHLGKNITILYVEDDSSLMKTTQAMFQNIFDNVHTAINGEEGLEKYESYLGENGKSFDLVVTDIRMPKMDGLTLATKIKKLNPQQLIVVTSAYDDSGDLINFINLGIKRFIKKPFTLEGIVTSFLDIVEDLESEQHRMKLIEGYSWNMYDKRLYREDEEIKLSFNETLILDLFFNNKDQIFSNDDLFCILERDNFSKELSIDSIKSILKRLRKKIPPNLIQNIYSQGYRLDKSLITAF